MPVEGRSGSRISGNTVVEKHRRPTKTEITG